MVDLGDIDDGFLCQLFKKQHRLHDKAEGLNEFGQKKLRLNPAPKKSNLKVWFHASKTYREFVYRSNCTHYQSRKLEISSYGQKKQPNAVSIFRLFWENVKYSNTKRTIGGLVQFFDSRKKLRVLEKPFMPPLFSSRTHIRPATLGAASMNSGHPPSWFPLGLNSTRRPPWSSSPTLARVARLNITSTAALSLALLSLSCDQEDGRSPPTSSPGASMTPTSSFTGLLLLL
ncbi:hypothetical protein LXL04_034409 [Taraxacum kok-saghyz]